MKVKKVFNTAALVLSVFSTQLAFGNTITETLTCGTDNGTCCNPDITTCASDTQQFVTTSGKVTLAGNDTVNFNLGCYSNGTVQVETIHNASSGGTISCDPAASEGGGAAVLTCHNYAPDGGQVWASQYECLLVQP